MGSRSRAQSSQSRLQCRLSRHRWLRQRIPGQSLLFSQSFCPKTGSHFWEILLSRAVLWRFRQERVPDQQRRNGSGRCRQIIAFVGGASGAGFVRKGQQGAVPVLPRAAAGGKRGRLKRCGNLLRRKPRTGERSRVSPSAGGIDQERSRKRQETRGQGSISQTQDIHANFTARELIARAGGLRSEAAPVSLARIDAPAAIHLQGRAACAFLPQRFGTPLRRSAITPAKGRHS